MKRGVTLVELLAAMVLAALVVVLATRIFLSGNRQFLERSAQSDRLSGLYRVKSRLQAILRADITRCAAGRLWLRNDGVPTGENGIENLVKAHYPAVVSADFRCFETGPTAGDLVEWHERFQPNLVEYRIVLKQDGKQDSLSGSWIK